VGRRLVEDQEVSVGQKQARGGDPLALAAGQKAW
jgi:hypothetical protein